MHTLVTVRASLAVQLASSVRIMIHTRQVQVTMTMENAQLPFPADLCAPLEPTSGDYIAILHFV